MLIYYSLFDAIKAIYGEFIQIKNQTYNKVYNTKRSTQIDLEFIILNGLYGDEHNNITCAMYAMNTLHRKPSLCQHTMNCLLSCKVIVSIAFDSKINKTICRWYKINKTMYCTMDDRSMEPFSKCLWCLYFLQ